MSLERGVCSCAESQVFSCYRGWKETCQTTRAISTTWRHELSSFFSCKAQGAERNYAMLIETLGEQAPLYATIKNWVAQFKCGDFSTMRLVLDDKNSDHPGDYWSNSRANLRRPPDFGYINSWATGHLTLGPSFMKIWTCGISPWGGSQNAWTRI